MKKPSTTSTLTEALEAARARICVDTGLDYSVTLTPRDPHFPPVGHLTYVAIHYTEALLAECGAFDSPSYTCPVGQFDAAVRLEAAEARGYDSLLAEYSAIEMEILKWHFGKTQFTPKQAADSVRAHRAEHPPIDEFGANYAATAVVTHSVRELTPAEIEFTQGQAAAIEDLPARLAQRIPYDRIVRNLEIEFTQGQADAIADLTARLADRHTRAGTHAAGTDLMEFFTDPACRIECAPRQPGKTTSTREQSVARIKSFVLACAYISADAYDDMIVDRFPIDRELSYYACVEHRLDTAFHRGGVDAVLAEVRNIKSERGSWL
jgi:hypothetical protein